MVSFFPLTYSCIVLALRNTYANMSAALPDPSMISEGVSFSMAVQTARIVFGPPPNTKHTEGILTGKTKKPNKN